MFSLSAFCVVRVHFTLWNHFQKTPEVYNPWNFSKLDLSSGAHMGNQMLLLHSLWKMCAGASIVWNYSSGWAKKRQPAKDCHLDSTQCRSFVMILLHSTGITYSIAISFHFFFYFLRCTKNSCCRHCFHCHVDQKNSIVLGLFCHRFLCLVSLTV